jgi:hypothetical protein
VPFKAMHLCTFLDLIFNLMMITTKLQRTMSSQKLMAFSSVSADPLPQEPLIVEVESSNEAPDGEIESAPDGEIESAPVLSTEIPASTSPTKIDQISTDQPQSLTTKPKENEDEYELDDEEYPYIEEVDEEEEKRRNRFTPKCVQSLGNRC